MFDIPDYVKPHLCKYLMHLALGERGVKTPDSVSYWSILAEGLIIQNRGDGYTGITEKGLQFIKEN